MGGEFHTRFCRGTAGAGLQFTRFPRELGLVFGGGVVGDGQAGGKCGDGRARRHGFGERGIDRTGVAPGHMAPLPPEGKNWIEGEANLFALPWRRRSSTRDRLGSLVSRLGLPDDWSVEEFIEAVERMRGRRIVQLPLPERSPVGLCGLWLARPDDDLVLHRRCWDPTMEKHMVAHEVAHMLLGHDRLTSPRELATMLAGVDLGGEPGSPAPVVQTARGASTYSDRAEYEAELLATLVMRGARKDGALRRDRMLRTF